MKKTLIIVLLLAVIAICLAIVFRNLGPAEDDGYRSPRERAMIERFDKDGDGKLNNEERQAADSAAELTADQLMSYMDSNGDGKITLEEAPEELKEGVGFVDRNGDGGIDVKEAQVMAEYNRE